MRRLETWVSVSLLLGAAASPVLAQPPTLPDPNPFPIPKPAAETPVTTGMFSTPPSAAWGIVGGGSVYILKPYFSSNPAYSTNVGLGTPTPSQATTDFSWSYNAAPAVWLGWIDDRGLGFRVRDFYFYQTQQQAATSLTPAQAAKGSIVPPSGLASPPGTATFGSPGVILTNGLGSDVLNFGSNLKINALDVEGMWDVRRGNWGILVSGGGRYLQLAQNYHATLMNSATTAVGSATENDVLNTGHNFYGGGPTAAFQTLFQVARTGFFLYGLARGSLLVGTSHQTTGFNQLVNDPAGIVGGNQKSSTFASSSRDLVMPVLELEVGVQYCLTLGRTMAFVRGAVVDQTYFDAGSASQTSGNLGLFGAQVSAGLNY